MAKYRPRKMNRYKEPRRKRATQRSELEETLAAQIQQRALPSPEREYRFCAHHVGMGPGIRARLQQAGLSDWRFDFAWPGLMLAVEVDGGQWVEGGHNTGVGSERDFKKSHYAARLGWTVYRCNGGLLQSGLALMFIENWIQNELDQRKAFQDLLNDWWRRALAAQENAQQLLEEKDYAGAAMFDHGCQRVLSCREELKRLLQQ